MRGTYSTAGLLRFHQARNTLDCPAVQTVLQLGAVPFCKTNVPQVLYKLILLCDCAMIFLMVHCIFIVRLPVS